MRCLIAIAALAPLIASGCAGVHSAGFVPCEVVRSAGPPAEYRIGCPDVLAVRLADRPLLDCVVAVDLDGRLPLSDTIQPQVDGLSIDETRQSVATAAGCDPSRVLVELADARTGRLYVFGPERNRQRVLPYIGAERLVDFLVRTDSLQRGSADLRDVFVLRPNVAAGREPEVFRANLIAVQAGDHTTNVVLEPGDQVFVGETRRSSFARLLPDWMKGGYCRLAGVNTTLSPR